MHRPRILAAVVAGVIAAGAAGCPSKARRKQAPADAGAAGPRVKVLPPMTPSALPPQPPVAMPRELRFVLLDAGTGARKPLRYRGGAAARELPARATVKTHGFADGVWSDELTLAPVSDGFGVETEAASGGNLVVHLRGLPATIDRRASAAAVAATEGYVARWRKLLEKRRADVVIDRRGRLQSAALLDDPTAADVDARDELVQRWLGLVVPLPDEPVAVGARWRVVSLVRSGGVVLKQTATYRLTAADAAGWTVELEAQRIGEAQEILVPGVDGPLGELVALRRLVKGTLSVTAADPLPVRGTLSSEVSTHARFRVPGGVSEHYTDDNATVVLGP